MLDGRHDLSVVEYWMLLWDDDRVDIDLRCERCFYRATQSVQRREQRRGGTHFQNLYHVCPRERFFEDIRHTGGVVSHNVTGLDVRGNGNDGCDTVKLADHRCSRTSVKLRDGRVLPAMVRTRTGKGRRVGLTIKTKSNFSMFILLTAEAPSNARSTEQP